MEKEGGQPWERLLDYAKATAELSNLSAAMGDLTNALSSAGQHDAALAVAASAQRIPEALGNQREVAVGHGLFASILMASGRYDAADACYNLALAVARRVGDKELEGTFLQHQGSLADDRNQHERASRLYRQALERLREAGDHLGVMQTYNLLGVSEQNAGRLAEARAWYEKSRELAVQLEDQVGLGQAAQNIGVVWQEEGEAARERGDEPSARRCFEEARRSVEESLQVWQDQPYEAMALVQLAKIELRLGNLVEAEQQALQGLAIDEELQVVRELPSDYEILSEIAQARGDQAAAAKWAEKRDDLLAELERRAGEGGA